MDDVQLKRRQEQQRLIEEHLQNRQRVQTLFAKYGGDACRVIWEELRRHRGLHPVLQRLGLPAAASLEDEFDMLQRFIRDHGAGMFLKQIRPNQNCLDWDVFDKSGAPAADPSATGGFARPDAAATVVIKRPTAAGAAAPGAPTAETTGPNAITPPEWIDDGGKYVGPERRTAQRRTGRDRRGDIEAISRNKRFGGDRRRNKGRRKTDVR